MKLLSKLQWKNYVRERVKSAVLAFLINENSDKEKTKKCTC